MNNLKDSYDIFPDVFETGPHPYPAFMAFFSYERPKNFTLDRLLGDWICLNSEISRDIIKIRSSLGIALKKFPLELTNAGSKVYDFFTDELDSSLPLNNTVIDFLEKYHIPVLWGESVAAAILTNTLLLPPSQSGVKFFTGFNAPDGQKKVATYFPSIVLTRQTTQTKLRKWLKNNWEEVENGLRHLPYEELRLNIQDDTLEVGRLAYFWKKQNWEWMQMADEISQIKDRHEKIEFNKDIGMDAGDFEKAYKSYKSALKKMSAHLGK